MSNPPKDAPLTIQFSDYEAIQRRYEAALAEAQEQAAAVQERVEFLSNENRKWSIRAAGFKDERDVARHQAIRAERERDDVRAQLAEVDRLTAALAEAREQAARIERAASVAGDEWERAATEVAADLAFARADLARMRPVVEAARRPEETNDV